MLQIKFEKETEIEDGEKVGVWRNSIKQRKGDKRVKVAKWEEHFSLHELNEMQTWLRKNGEGKTRS